MCETDIISGQSDTTNSEPPPILSEHLSEQNQDSVVQINDSTFDSVNPPQDGETEINTENETVESYEINDLPHSIDVRISHLETLLSAQSAVLNEVKSLANELIKEFTTKLKYDTTKQTQIDKLYNENITYKEGIIKKFQATIILAVIEQIDYAMKQTGHFEVAEFSETNFQKLLDSYREIAMSFQDMLFEKFDVSNYCCAKETPFDPKLQRVLKTVKTDDNSKNKLVKTSIRSGYKTGDETILRPELVEVYVYEATKQND
ncbi:MAG: nucleotide exchange factor GrpE [Planctomycetaceae bacterium]|jgi:molecular chaperone GrpE (heat shock protein)|nr:nucleotide exchange factor GrpE [Planctomycetaceae bacterium]